MAVPYCTVIVVMPNDGRVSSMAGDNILSVNDWNRVEPTVTTRCMLKVR